VPEDLDIGGEEGVSGSVSFTGTGWESNGEFRFPGSISSGLGESKGHRVFKQLCRGNRKSNRMVIKRNHRSPYTLGGPDWIEDRWIVTSEARQVCKMTMQEKAVPDRQKLAPGIIPGTVKWYRERLIVWSGRISTNWDEK